MALGMSPEDRANAFIWLLTDDLMGLLAGPFKGFRVQMRDVFMFLLLWLAFKSKVTDWLSAPVSLAPRVFSRLVIWPKSQTRGFL